MIGSTPRILVVNPKPGHRAVLAKRLGGEGFVVTTADGGRNALALMHRSPSDLLLAELSMPQMDGIQLTAALRGVAAWRDLPVILISGRGEKNGIVRALAGGADDVVVKPFHFEVLVARIARQLERARALGQLRADMAAMDARAVDRAIALGELRDKVAGMQRAIPLRT